MTKQQFTAVAITSNGDQIPFGPNFQTEEEAWYWLHMESDMCIPVHKSIEVFPLT